MADWCVRRWCKAKVTRSGLCGGWKEKRGAGYGRWVWGKGSWWVTVWGRVWRVMFSRDQCERASEMGEDW